MPKTDGRLLLASIHDVSPRFESEVDRLHELLAPHVGSRIAMLVVPNHWGDAPIVASRPFASRLRAWSEGGAEIFLHGFFHRDEVRHQNLADRLRARWMTAGEGEFLGISRREAERRIAEGKRLLEDISGRPIAGFVAPAWLYGQGSLAALSDARMPIAEDHMRVWSPATGIELARGPVITWATRSRMRAASSVIAARVLSATRMDVLRVGVHPPDVRHPAIARSVRATLKRAINGRTAASYADLF